MKTTRSFALSALASILVLIAMMGTSMAAVTITAIMGVSLSPISLSNAFAGVPKPEINVSTDPGQVFLSFKVSSDDGDFVLNSVTIDVSINGIVESSETYSNNTVGSTWSMIGVTDTDSYTSGSMNKGPIHLEYGSRGTYSPYPASLKEGGVWQTKATFHTNEGEIVSVGKVTYVPEPASALLAFLGFIFLLRRRR